MAQEFWRCSRIGQKVTTTCSSHCWRNSRRKVIIKSVSSFPQKRPLTNFTDIDVSSSLPSLVGTRTIPSSFKPFKWVRLKGVLSLGTSTCELVLNCPALKGLVRSGEKFDAYIVELFNTECFLRSRFEHTGRGRGDQQRDAAMDERHREESRNPQLHSELDWQPNRSDEFLREICQLSRLSAHQVCV